MREATETRISFHGNLILDGGDPPEFMATVRYARWDPTSLSIELLWIGNDESRRRGVLALERLGQNHVWLHSLDRSQSAVELLGIEKITLSHAGPLTRTSSVRAAAVQIGISHDSYGQPKLFNVVVQLQPSGILALPTIHEQHFQGHISVQHVEEGSIPLRLGKAELEAGLTYEYSNSEADGNRITNQVQRATLMGHVELSPTESLFEVHERLKADLTDVCIALSLCYRQSVDYYQIEYFNRDPLGARAIHRRRWNALRRRTAGDELINARALRNGGLQRLVESIQRSPCASELRQAIRFLASSFTAEPETAFFMAFSAMEAVLGCCLEESEELTIPASDWIALEQGLRKRVKELVPEGTIRSRIYEKLPELRRNALVRRIRAACDKYQPKTNDLWVDVPFADGFARAARTRHGLFHAAGAGPDVLIGTDLLRVRIFAERLLLKLVAWPDEDIWVWYDQDLKWANQEGR